MRSQTLLRRSKRLRGHARDRIAAQAAVTRSPTSRAARRPAAARPVVRGRVAARAVATPSRTSRGEPEAPVNPQGERTALAERPPNPAVVPGEARARQQADPVPVAPAVRSRRLAAPVQAAPRNRAARQSPAA